MGKNQTNQLVENISNKSKGKNKVKKINWETVKTVLIAVLVTAIVGFVGGIKYQQSYSTSVKSEAKALISQQASVPKAEVSKPQQ